jgi:TIR domain
VARETSRYACRMKIFLSWSTEPSKYIAAALKDWIPIVIQAAHPWFSPNDIERGARWSTEIAVQLEESKFGILCITSENLNAPWINFEAGALAKTLTKTHVVPLLYNLEPTDLVGPLSQFNATRLNKEDMSKLIHTINNSLDHSLDTNVIDSSFEMWWPKLEEKLRKIPKIELKIEKRTERDMIEEILEIVRAQKNVEISNIQTSDHSESELRKLILGKAEAKYKSLLSEARMEIHGNFLHLHYSSKQKFHADQVVSRLEEIGSVITKSLGKGTFFEVYLDGDRIAVWPF